jgi:hypothetical protein
MGRHLRVWPSKPGVGVGILLCCLLLSIMHHRIKFTNTAKPPTPAINKHAQNTLAILISDLRMYTYTNSSTNMLLAAGVLSTLVLVLHSKRDLCHTRNHCLNADTRGFKP